MLPKIKLALVEDDILVLELLSTFFSSDGKFEVGLIAESGRIFMEKFNKNPKAFDLLVLDLKMKDGNGIEVLEALKETHSELKIVVLSSYAHDALIGQMLKLGVNAFLPKQVDKEELASILMEVHSKGFYFTQDQVKVMREQVVNKPVKPLLRPAEELTSGEIQTLELMCRQFTAREIAQKLYVSIKTIESRKSNLMLKLDVKNMAGLIIAAVQKKLINPDHVIL